MKLIVYITILFVYLQHSIRTLLNYHFSEFPRSSEMRGFFGTKNLYIIKLKSWEKN